MAGTGSESFLSTFLNSKSINTDLPKEILDLLVEYYYNAYENKDFVALANIHVASPEAIPVLSKQNYVLWRKIYFIVIVSIFCILLLYQLNLVKLTSLIIYLALMAAKKAKFG
ncbi:hypothetical protein RhiirC2_719777 [Rhizophagus irregularis]|uniref:Uncharacterized protein n=1 Tax=Rhizophagus irregularis TaxID=588596 RepID=A0A2N1MD19_9GLOM|nr:hypothetical protein RhiirC2_719777 [Rhizophagus irregularis]